MLCQSRVISRNLICQKRRKKRTGKFPDKAGHKQFGFCNVLVQISFATDKAVLGIGYKILVTICMRVASRVSERIIILGK